MHVHINMCGTKALFLFFTLHCHNISCIIYVLNAIHVYLNAIRISHAIIKPLRDLHDQGTVI